MDYEHEVRKLARTNFYQNLYHNSKTSPHIKIFHNSENFSGLQMFFLVWLETYALLYSELAEKKWSQLTEDVIKDDVVCEAFLYWRRKQIEKDITKQKMEENKSKLKLKNKSNVTSYNIRPE